MTALPFLLTVVAFDSSHNQIMRARLHFRSESAAVWFSSRIIVIIREINPNVSSVHFEAIHAEVEAVIWQNTITRSDM